MRPRGVKRLFTFSSRTRDEVRADIGEEMGFHLDMRTEELTRLGLSPADARAQALRELGGAGVAHGAGPVAASLAREGDRLERRRRFARLFAEVRQDASIALRLLRRAPGFAFVAILTLALGIGANTAIFSAVDAVLLRPLPYPDSDRLMAVVELRENGGTNSAAGGVFLDWRQHQTQFVGLALLKPVTFNLRGAGGTPDRVRGQEVSHELLSVLGVEPLLGRGFMPEDDRPGGRNDVVMLTEELWRARFGGDPSILGRAILMDEVPRTVIGILPRGAWLFREDGFLVPAVLQPGTERAARAPHWATVFGRLQPGVTRAQAETELRAIKQQLNAQYPTFKQQWSVGVRPLPEMIAGPSRPVLLMLLGAVSLVLLIACANVANLLLARACHRESEIALRAALGATGSRIVRQVLTESLVLAACGGVAGLAMAYWTVGLLRRLTELIPGAQAPQLDLRVLAFSLLITGATGLLFGIMPALRARKWDINDTLKNGGKNATAGGRQRTQATLVIAEVALTVVLLASAGLLLRSLANAAAVDPGFDPARVLAFDLSLPEATYTTNERRLTYANELLTRLRALPGVDAAGAGMAIPFSSGGFGEDFAATRQSSARDEALGRMDFVSPGYLEALGTRLIAGRTFAGADNVPDGPRVAVISASTARRFFADRSPLGEELRVAGNNWRIIGIVADKANVRLDSEQPPFAYVPQAFNPSSFSVVIRTTLSPLSLVESVRRELLRLDAGVAIANPRALDRAMAGSMTPRRMVLTLVAIFAAGALALASIGLYGVMAYSVVMRRREISIRMALGAARADVLRYVLGGGARLVAAGLVLGTIGALGVTRLLTSQLYQVRSDDPLVILGTMAAVAAVALIACWMPAWRASRFDAIAALRND